MRTRFRVETIRVSRKEHKTLLVLQVLAPKCTRRYPDGACPPGREPCKECGVWRDARVEDFTTTPAPIVVDKPTAASLVSMFEKEFSRTHHEGPAG